VDAVAFRSLLHLAQGGDRAAMDEVIEMLRPRLERLAHAYADPLRPAESTSDLLQDSCLRAWNSLGSFQGGHDDEVTFAMFRAWILQIVRRIGLDARKARDRQRRIPPKKLRRLDASGVSTGSGADGAGEPGESRTPSEYAQVDESMERVLAALDAVSDQTDSTILQLYYSEGFTLRQIADQTGLPYDKVKERYWTTMRLLQGMLREEY